jgi:SH3 domain protein
VLCFLISANAVAQNAQGNENTEPNDETGDFRYVSSDLFTYIRSGPGDQYRLLGSVTAGSRIQVLQTNTANGYTEIIDSRQRTGWIETKFVSEQPSYRLQAEQLQAKLEETETIMVGLQQDTNAAQERAKKAREQANELNRKVSEQLEEIARLNESIEQRERSNNMQWFTRGSILAVIAIIIGYIMGLTGRRNRSRGGLI